MVFRDKIEVHNAAALIPGEHGFSLYRVPEEVFKVLERPDAAAKWTGVELRFVIEEGNQATVHIFSNDTDPGVSRVCALYLGSQQHGWQWLLQKQIHPGMNDITVTLPDNMEELESRSKAYHDPFSARVVRLVMPTGKYELCDVEGKVRPSRQDELPERYGVFYGSSITHGAAADVTSASYVSIATQELKIDSFNKGMSGACYMETEFLDYLLTYRDAAFLSVEVGTNCYGKFDDEELRRRVEHLIRQFKKDPAGRQLFLIDCLAVKEKYDGCRKLVRDCVSGSQCPSIHYINGMSLLPNMGYLTTDGVHPSLVGQIHIGQRYAEILRQYL